MISKKLLAVTLFFLVFIPFVIAETTTDPYPTIVVSYDNLNAPITIVQQLLTDRFGNVIPLTTTSNAEQWQFNFTPRQYLHNQDYTFEIEAEDSESNLRKDVYDITVDVEYMPIYVTKPLSPLFIGEDTQDFAVGTTLPFDMEIRTAAPTLCRIKSTSDGSFSPAEEWNYAVREFNDGSITPSMLHTMPMVANAQGSTSVFSPPPLNYNNLFANTFVLVCEQRMDPEPQYHMKTIFLGYDNTPPEFDITFTPSLIEDPSNVSTIMNITTTGDLVACTYDLFGQAQLATSGQVPTTITSFEDLFSTTERIFDYSPQKQIFNYGQSYTFTLRANCTNPAGLWTVRNESFVIERSSELQIQLAEQYFSTTKPTLTLTTNIGAQACWFEENNTQYFFQTTNNIEHTYSAKTFKEGRNTLRVTCRAIEGTLASRTFSLYIDATAPLTPVIGSGTDHCENRMSILINAPDPEDDVRYNISLYNSTTTTEANMILGPELTSFTDDDLLFRAPRSLKTKQNASYTWIITPLDRAGNKGPQVKHTVTKVSPDSITCDVTPPLASADVKKTETGYQVNISCKDAESGCTDSFRLSEIQHNQTCNYSQGTITPYTANPLLITSNKTLCYTVFDKAENEKSKLVKLTVDIEQLIAASCSNGYEDIDEEGIDCGGVCDEPCPPKEVTTYDSGDNETDDEEEDERRAEPDCYTDFDCMGTDEICMDGNCVYSPSESTGPSTLGLILLILGLLLMGGGIGYIVYAEKQKENYNKQKAMHTQLTAEQQAALAAKRLAEEKKYLEELKKKREAGDAKKQQLSKEKQEERSKLLGSFEEGHTATADEEATEDAKEETTTRTDDKEIFGPEPIRKEPKKDEPPKKLDEGLEGDFVELEKLGSSGTTDTPEDKDVFSDLKKINEKHKEQKEDDDKESTN